MTLTVVLLALIAGEHFADCIKLDPEVDVGGDAGENEFPFMVQLQRYWAVSYLQECGGSLLTASWLLTAAHCNENKPKLQALAGTVRRNDRTNGQRRPVVRFVSHERYVLDGETGPYDIALALVEEPFLVDGVSVATIELPSVASVWRESNGPDVMTVLGYGKIDQSDTMPEVLQTVTVHSRPSADCGKDPVPVGTFCVGSPGSTACQGDSGGPVVGWGDDSIPRLVGVVSFGSRTCGAKPITCTDVAAYMDWINGTLSSAGEMISAF